MLRINNAVIYISNCILAEKVRVSVQTHVVKTKEGRAFHSISTCLTVNLNLVKWSMFIRTTQHAIT